MAVIDFFDRGWRIRPLSIAYVKGDQALTYAEAGELSCEVANTLVATGLNLPAKAAVLS